MEKTAATPKLITVCIVNGTLAMFGQLAMHALISMSKHIININSR